MCTCAHSSRVIIVQITGNDASTGASRNRVGQISHSVLLGTFNVGDQGEGIVPDLSQVCYISLSSNFFRCPGLVALKASRGHLFIHTIGNSSIIVD